MASVTELIGGMLGEGIDPLGPIEDFAREDGPFRPLGDDEVKSALSQEIRDSHGAISSGSRIAEDRRQALRYYYGRPFGNEVEGRSQVVSTDVADTIHWIMPSLMRMFCSGQDIFEYVPVTEDDEACAREATEYINHMLFEEWDGFNVLYEVFFDALLERNGTLIVEVEDRFEPKIERYQGQSEAEVTALLEDGRGLQPIEFGERQIQTPAGVEVVYDMTVRVTNKLTKLCLRSIPNEEFLFPRREIKLDDDISFVGERRKLRASDLIAMGFDPERVSMLPTDDSVEFAQSRIERREEDQEYPITSVERPDKASREHWVNNCYMRIDQDGDGYAELRHFLAVGDEATEILFNDYANYPPFASFCASPVPHKFHGQSIFDLIGDLQKIRSTLMRQMLDNLYLTNNPVNKVIPDQVNLNDLLTWRPGGYVRVESMDAMAPVEMRQITPVVLEMDRILDERREIRVGVSRFTQGLDGSHMNKTATAFSGQLGASQQRIELIGRIFQHGGMKRLGKLLLRALRQNGFKARRIRLGGEWKDVDPSQWNESMDVKVNTGLGVGSQQGMIQFLMAMLQLQKEAILQGASFMVKPRDLYTTVEKLAKAMGFPKSTKFFEDPGDANWPAPAPDTKLLENQRRVADDQAKNAIAALQAQTESDEKKSLAEHRRRELEHQDTWKRMEIDARIQIARLQMEAAERKQESSGGPS